MFSTINLTQFNHLATQGYNRIPLIAETYADLDTPLGIYLKLAHSGPQAGKNTCLLESVVGGERFGRYSFIGLPARNVLRAQRRLLPDDVELSGALVRLLGGALQ